MYEGKHKISYYDLDLSGRVKLSSLLKMVHIAADANATELGVGFTELSRLNMSFILQRFALSVSRMPAYGETVSIRTWPDSVARGTFLRKGDMYDENKIKIMEWTSMWILFNIAERKILKPSALPITLPLFTDYGVNVNPEKITLPAQSALISKYTHTVRYADVDTNMHMNNSTYGDLIGNALFPDSNATESSKNWHDIQINYLAETRLGDEINIEVHRACNQYFVVGKTAEKTSFTARVNS